MPTSGIVKAMLSDWLKWPGSKPAMLVFASILRTLRIVRIGSRHGRLTMVGLLLTFAPVLANAATEVSGAVAANAVWSAAQSPYLVTADISIVNGATLVVEPAVVIQMNPGTRFVVSQGALRMKGAAGMPVVMTSSREATGAAVPGDWEQLVFLDGTNDAATFLDNVEIRFGKGVRIERASPTLDRVHLVANAGPAIEIDLESSPVGNGLQATGNAVNGIVVPAGEIGSSVQWKMTGIPYVVAAGSVSIGKAPTVTGISPDAVQPGQTIEAVIAGTRLGGAEQLRFDQPGLSATVSGTSSDTSIPVRIAATASVPLGRVPFEVLLAAGSARFEGGVNVIPVKPTITATGIAPASLRRGESLPFVITGNLLQGAQIAVLAGSGLSVSGVQTTPTQASFSLTAASGATLGAQLLTLTNPAVANGSATVSVTVMRALPKVTVSPAPLVVPPDTTPHTFTVRLTETDEIAHVVNLALADTSIASLSTATVSIAPGETQAIVSMTGIKQGYTVLNLSSPTLASVSVPVYVTSALANGATVGPLISMPVGVSRNADSASIPPGVTLTPLLSQPVGVDRMRDSVSLTPGATLGPLISMPVGVNRMADTTTLPAGITLGPLSSPPVGVSRASDGASLPVGMSVSPVLSVPVGVDRASAAAVLP